MKYNIDHNQQKFNFQTELYFDYAIAKTKEKKNKFLLYGLIFSLISFGILYLKEGLGFVFLSFGVFYLIFFYTYFQNIKKSKKFYFETIKMYSEDLSESSNQTAVWDFSEDYFSFSNSQFEIKTKWQYIKSFKKINQDNLILEANQLFIINFILSKDEVGEIEFDKIIKFLESKIKNK